MKRSLVLLILFFQFAFLAEGQVTWQKGYYIASIFYNVQQTLDSGFIATGISQQGLGSVLVIKTNVYGDTSWTKDFHSPAGYMGVYVSQTSDSGFVVTSSQGNTVAALIKIKANGDTSWTRRYSVNGNLFIYQTKETRDGGFVLIGSSSIGGSSSISVIKCDSLGSVSWVKNISSNGTGEAESILPIGNNCFVFVGQFNSGSCMILMDSLGDTLWTKCYDKLGAWEIRKDPGGYALFGYPNLGGVDMSIAKTDFAGNLQWLKIYHANSTVRGGFDCTGDGGYIINGLRLDSLQNQYGFMFKTDSIGDTLWCKNYGSNVSRFSNVCKSYTDGFICSGGTSGNWYGELIKTDTNGHTDCGETSDNFIVLTPNIQSLNPSITISTGNIVTGNPGFEIFQGGMTTTLCSSVSIGENLKGPISIDISPNPFDKQVNISSNNFIRSIDILSLFGEKICSMQLLLPGKLEMQIDSNSLKPGIYFVKVETENGTSVQKLIKQ